MDGIGGVVKQSVFMACCLRENLAVQTAAEFCEVAQKKCPKVTITFNYGCKSERSRSRPIDLTLGPKWSNERPTQQHPVLAQLVPRWVQLVEVM